MKQQRTTSVTSSGTSTDGVDTVEIRIDGKPFRVPKTMTILEAARANDIYIPTLCWHEELTPHGGCRMCIVEVEGLRNLPTACTTPVSEGMTIRTHTAQVQDARREILQLFMSEHPSSCLVCDESAECSVTLRTIRKAGVTTGCRYCSKDQWCELQAVAKYLEVEHLEYPIHYRGLKVEKEDPFYDRDYNLCILCGRCVRVCQEVRLSNVLAFKHRGRDAVVGPAFERSHLDAGCEFCGACVEICPVGALKEKVRAWEGEQEREVMTTCSYCGVGCQVRLLLSHNRVIGSLPVHDDVVNNGQLCVKGRFCVTEMVGGQKRLKQPYHLVGDTRAEVSWDEALDLAAEKLRDCKPDEFGMVVSANLTNEDLYAAQKFTRAVMQSHNVDCSARLYYGDAFNTYLGLFAKSTTLQDVESASTILCVGLDSRFGRSVVGVALRRAMRRGARVITVNPRHHALTLTADVWLQSAPGTEAAMLESLASGASPAKKNKSAATDHSLIDEAAAILQESTRTVILLGSEFMQLDESNSILKAVHRIADVTKASVLPLPAQNNLLGSLLMGAYPEILPGAGSSSEKKALDRTAKVSGTKLPAYSDGWNTASLKGKKKLKVLYVIGDTLPEQTPGAEFVISQNIYPPDGFFHADLVLPAAAFTETEGTFVSGEGRVQKVSRGLEPFGRSLPDWQILSRLAKKLDANCFEYQSAADVHREIGKLVPLFDDFENLSREPHQFNDLGILNGTKPARPKLSAADLKSRTLLITTAAEHTHRGFSLAAWVPGSRQLLTEGVLDMNPEDARRQKISDGDMVTVSSSLIKRSWPVRVLADQPAGTVHVTLQKGEVITPNPHPVKLRKVRRHV